MIIMIKARIMLIYYGKNHFSIAETIYKLMMQQKMKKKKKKFGNIIQLLTNKKQKITITARIKLIKCGKSYNLFSITLPT